MDLCLKNRLAAGATTISNTFVDQYMADASGEYVKVYLYFLRHAGETITIEAIADALNHTEADVRRALAYWQRVGILDRETENKHTRSQTESVNVQVPATAFRREAAGQADETRAMKSRREPSPQDSDRNNERTREADAAAGEKKVVCDMERLSDDENFSQLLYIAQKYLNKTFTPNDCQVLANLYVNLGMASELLEYLMEYSAQNNHASLRYIEKVAINWHEKKIVTVEQAKAYSRSFSKESFAVMKAMGLTGRNPADMEYEMMERWFRQYGFTKEIVVEACNRTIKTIHNPSFQYADRILTDWKSAGVRTLSDIEALDKRRKDSDKKSAATSVPKKKGNKSGTANRFHNLEQHGYDYDEMVWNMINSDQDTGGGDGTQ